MEQQDRLFHSGADDPIITPREKAPKMSRDEIRRLEKRRAAQARRLNVPTWAVAGHQYCMNSLWLRQAKSAVPPQVAKKQAREAVKLMLEDRHLDNAQLDQKYTTKHAGFDRSGNAYQWSDARYRALCAEMIAQWGTHFLQPLLAGERLARGRLYDWWHWMLFPEGPFSFWMVTRVTGFHLPDWLTSPDDLRHEALVRGLLPVWLDAVFDLPEDEQLLALKALTAHDAAIRTTTPAATAIAVAA